MLSEKNKNIFVIESFKSYFQKYLCNNIKRWTCCKRLCQFYVKLNNEHKITFSKIYHIHDKHDEQKLNSQQLFNNLKRKATDYPFKKPKKKLTMSCQTEILVLVQQIIRLAFE